MWQWAVLRQRLPLLHDGIMYSEYTPGRFTNKATLDDSFGPEAMERIHGVYPMDRVSEIMSMIVS